MNMADTGEVMNYVQAQWPIARETFHTDYAWVVYHSKQPPRFLTSDDPCQWTTTTEAVMMPLALDLALVGRITHEGEEPSFRHSNASGDLVRKLNRETARGCRSFVYAHEQTEALSRFLKKHYVPEDVLLSGRSFTNDPEPMGEQEVARFIERFEALRNRDRKS